MVRAHVIRFNPPFQPEEASAPHYHEVDFQMIYVLKGWYKTEFEGKGVHTFETGSCWIQPLAYQTRGARVLRRLRIARDYSAGRLQDGSAGHAVARRGESRRASARASAVNDLTAGSCGHILARISG
jgi:hypothetical protein